MRSVPWRASAVIFSKGSHSLQIAVVNAEETHDLWLLARMLEITGRFCRVGDEGVGGADSQEEAGQGVGFN